MVELRQARKTLFGRELEDEGWSTNQSGRKVISFGAYTPGMVTEGKVDEKCEKELQGMLRFVDACAECREKLRSRAGGDVLGAWCSELWRVGIVIRK